MHEHFAFGWYTILYAHSGWHYGLFFDLSLNKLQQDPKTLLLQLMIIPSIDIATRNTKTAARSSLEDPNGAAVPTDAQDESL